MAHVANPLDGTKIYFEDEGGDGAVVVFHAGLLDSTATAREGELARAIGAEFRTVFVDHRGLGRSDKPHDPEAYAIATRVADAVAVLDELNVDQAHFVGMSWGGRLCFGIGQHAPDRVRSLVCGGQQPYAWPDSPLTRVVTKGLAEARTRGTVALVAAMESFWNTRFPAATRDVWIANDAAALDAMWTKVLSEGAVAHDLHEWRIPCLIFLGAGDADFIEQAERAAEAIPTAEFVTVDAADHIEAHLGPGASLVDRALSLLRRTSASAAY